MSSVSRIRRGSTLLVAVRATSTPTTRSPAPKQPAVPATARKSPPSCQRLQRSLRSPKSQPQRASPSVVQDRRRRTAQFSQGHGPSNLHHTPPFATHDRRTLAIQMAPSTFASAAAGSNSTANSTRNDSGGEWSVHPPLRPPRDISIHFARLPVLLPPPCLSDP